MKWFGVRVFGRRGCFGWKRMLFMFSFFLSSFCCLDSLNIPRNDFRDDSSRWFMWKIFVEETSFLCLGTFHS